MRKWQLLFCALVLIAWRCPFDSDLVQIDQKAIATTGELVSKFVFSHERAKKNLEFFAAEPHPFGSDRQQEIAQFIVREISAAGALAEVEVFQATVPNIAGLTKPAPLTREVSGRNIFAWFGVPPRKGSEQKCFVLIGSHYDTKAIPGVSYRGANDSGSSSIALIEFLHFFQGLTRSQNIFSKFRCSVGLVWFDGEESVLPGWSDGQLNFPVKIVDNTYGSRYSVQNGQSAHASAFVLLDMIGSPHLRLTRDSHSSPMLMKFLETAFTELGVSENLLSSQPIPVEDDHIPFLQAGIPALNIIDMHDLSVWHRPGDDPDWVSLKSVEKASRLGLFVALMAAMNPQEIR